MPYRVVATEILDDTDRIVFDALDNKRIRSELCKWMNKAESAETRAEQLEAERDEARKQLEQAQKQIAELEVTLKDIATAPYENQTNDGDEWEKEYYLRGLHH